MSEKVITDAYIVSCPDMTTAKDYIRVEPVVDITIYGSTVENVTKNLEVLLKHNKPVHYADFRKMVDVFDYHNDDLQPEHITPLKELVDVANELGYTGKINTRNLDDDPRLNTWAWKDETRNECIFRTDNYGEKWTYENYEGTYTERIRIECSTVEELLAVVKEHENSALDEAKQDDGMLQYVKDPIAEICLTDADLAFANEQTDEIKL